VILKGRTVVRATLLATGAVAAFALAACGGAANNTASGNGGGSPSTAAGGASTGGATFVPVTPTTASSATAHNGGAPAQSGGSGSDCKAADLKLSLGPTDGAAGHIYQALRFTNVSDVTCTMTGFPGVSYVTGDNGTQVGAPAQRDGAVGPTVTLAPGQVASSVVAMTDVGVFDPGACQPTPTRGFRVYPPNSTASMFVAENGTGCAGNPPSPQLRVQTVKPGAGSA
jgi:hypothetical protein